jgi:hypothetical protein
MRTQQLYSWLNRFCTGGIMNQLDVILKELVKLRFTDKGSPYFPTNENVNEAKQAILYWIDREVIGEDEELPMKQFAFLDEHINSQNKLRAEQRTILSQHGYKGGKK